MIPAGPGPTVTAATNASIVCLGQNAVLTAGGASTYSWSTGCVNSTCTITPASIVETFTVTGTDAIGCFNSAAVTISISFCTDIDETKTENAGAIFYPNPTTGNINIEFDIAETETGTVQITNLLGEVIFSEKISTNKIMYNIQNYPAGIYILALKQNSLEKTFRIIKQ